MTMSDSGPVPRSHSPLVLVRFSRSILGFLLTYHVSQTSRFFIFFLFDCFTEPAPQLDHLGRRGADGSPMPPRPPLVAHRPMQASQARFQPHPNHLVIVRATEP